MSYFNGAKLREIRIGNGMSLTDVFRRTGVSRSQISLIENGKADPRMSTVVSLLSCYGSNLAQLEPLSPSTMTLDEVTGWARIAARRLEVVGLGPSDPRARLDWKAARGADVGLEREALATRL